MNRRYGEAVARAKANSRAEAAGIVPRTLSHAELGDAPATHPRGVVAVRAWVHIGNAAL